MVVVIFEVVVVEVNEVLAIAVVVDCIVIFAVVDCIVVGCIVVVSFSCKANHTPTPMPVPNLSYH